MDTSNRPKLNINKEELKNKVEENIDQVDALYQQVKDKANDLYEGSKKTVNEAQHNISECRDQLIEHVKEKPLVSLLIAGGIGFILSSLLKK